MADGSLRHTAVTSSEGGLFYAAPAALQRCQELQGKRLRQLRRAVDDPGASSLDRVLALSSLEAVVTDRATAAAVASERDDLARQLGVRVRPPAVATG